MAVGTTQQHQAHPYNNPVRITDRHVLRCGVIQVPKAGADGTEPSLIKVHAQYQYRVVDFFISETGSEPLAPKAEAQEGEVLKYANVILEVAQINIGGYVPPGAGSGVGSGFSGGGANAAAGAANQEVAKAPGAEERIIESHVFTKRGRYVFVRKTVITQDDDCLKYPQAPYDEQAPIPCDPASWKTTLLGSCESSGGSQGSKDGAGVPPAKV